MAVAEAPFVSLGDWKTAQRASFLVGSETTLGSGGRGPQARSVLQGLPVSAAWPGASLGASHSPPVSRGRRQRA